MAKNNNSLHFSKRVLFLFGKTLDNQWFRLGFLRFISDYGCKLGTCRFLHRIFYANNQLCYLSVGKVKDKNGIPELQIIVYFNKPENVQEIYKERWLIETAFRALKSSGFNIEDTHLTY